MDRQNQNSKINSPAGRAGSQNLEGVMEEFYSGKADVLVCTTIIGSGLDMPNVNTIIIENAQRFGLADLHQLRGRVGRSSRKAYALLFYPKGYVPVGDALERLISIASAKELGAGFALAKKDLEIRGAGNLLGTAQHGNISLVGFELYLQLLSQQIEKLKSTAGVK
jgi:transcription-repair coupling factor (superfamily II helicase)